VLIKAPSYEECFADQSEAFGSSGQERLRRASVLVIGAGGIGTQICSILALSGIGKITIVDPQCFETGNLNRCPFARPRDVGRAKSDLIAGFFEGRPHLTVVPIVACGEDIEDLQDVEDVTMVVIASNTIASRVATAKFAIRHAIPHVAAGVADGRIARAGVISVWLPELPHLACAACFLEDQAQVARGESVLPTMTSTIGSVAATIAVHQLAAGDRRQLDHGNYLKIDIDRWMSESITVLRRSDCAVCETHE
jgi:molybdopterin-synthase adenylyltransferase